MRSWIRTSAQLDIILLQFSITVLGTHQQMVIDGSFYKKKSTKTRILLFIGI
jgi:hypothetical protein